MLQVEVEGRCVVRVHRQHQPLDLRPGLARGGGQGLQAGAAITFALDPVIDLQGMQGGGVGVGPMGQERRALEQQERHRDFVGQQGEALDPGLRRLEQGMQRGIDIAGIILLLRVHFERVELLQLRGVELFVGHESGGRWAIHIRALRVAAGVAILAILPGVPVFFPGPVDLPGGQTTKGVFTI
ncbi:hypothetical protein EMIT0373P_30454 [Pseudomonas chlororaphis]